MFGLGAKDEMEFEDWVGCIKGDAASWNKMIKYNINDVTTMEKLYVKFIPWIKGHANHSLYSDGSELVCPNCGGNKLHKRGYAYTLASVYQRYRCVDCGHWSKDNKVLNRKTHKTTSIAT